MNKSRWYKKRKRWLDRNSKQIIAKKEKTYSGTIHNKHLKRTGNKKKEYENVILKVPEVFSFLENAEKTMQFIEEIMHEIRKKEYKKIFVIDSSDVSCVTVDALIYLIAIMNNNKLNYQMKYYFKGNLPNNADARKVYEESGFMRYVKSNIKRLPPSSDKKQIIKGDTNNPEITKQLCQFVMEKLKKERKDIRNLQAVFIELMSNVFHHAYYKDANVIEKNWYIYAEHVGNNVHVVFIDTGVGITSTVKKQFKEKIGALFGKNTKDGELLHSTFRGDFRTRTKEGYRGNGLPNVKKMAAKKPFAKFNVISGHGRYSVNHMDNGNTEVDYETYSGKIYGTLFSFDIV